MISTLTLRHNFDNKCAHDILLKTKETHWIRKFKIIYCCLSKLIQILHNFEQNYRHNIGIVKLQLTLYMATNCLMNNIKL